MGTLFRLPKPSFWIALAFQSGSGGWKVMAPAFRQPSGTVTITAAPLKTSPARGHTQPSAT